MNLFDLLGVSARRAPEKILLKDDPEAGPGRSWTAAALLAAAERLAAGLFAWGLRPGDRVAFLLGNRPEFILGYLAVLRLGAVMVPINLAYRR
ncbi:MAG TPA: AMP-binding protein, partial [Thermoanaerobaculia bacterium]|nr:AMP-binding protein [Thermoanaerobaculia bacterium]